MLLAVDFDVPISYFHLLLHLFFAEYELALNGTSNMESLLATIKIALDAGALLLFAYATDKFESAVVKVAAELFEMPVIRFEPDLIVPIHTCVVYPFIADKVNHSTSHIVAE